MKKLTNDLFLRAARQEKVERIPVWYMRQAGRSQPEYRKLKEKYSLFEITRHPELCAYVTRLPVENYQVDAAILYKDIMTPLPSIGIDVEIKEGVGPVIERPIRTKEDIEALLELHPEEDIPYCLETIKLLTKEQLNVPLIGFAGAPFTLASYIIEGGPSKNYRLTKSFMYNNEGEWRLLMKKLKDMTVAYLKSQIESGASAVQIFDSWVGALSREDYVYYLKPMMKELVNEIKLSYPLVPIIMQSVAANHLLPEFHELAVDVVGIDWRISVSDARKICPQKALQGNLDPALLLSRKKCLQKADLILQEATRKNGFIFNLGHGVFPDASPEMLRELTSHVHETSADLLKKENHS